MSQSPVIVEELEDNATPRAEKPRRYTLTVEEERSVYNNEEMKAERDCNRMCLVATQWIVRCLLGVVTLGCLVSSRVSFAVMVEQFSGNRSNANVSVSVSSSDSKKSQFWLLLFAILVPHAFSFVRCVWIGLQLLRINQQTYYPWPSTGAKVWGFVTSLSESLLVAVFVFGFAPKATASSALVITSSCGVFLGAIVWRLYVLFRSNKNRNGCAGGVSRNREETFNVQSNVTDSAATKLLDNGTDMSKAESGHLFRRYFAKPKIQKLAMITALVLELFSIAFIILSIDMVDLKSSKIPKVLVVPCFIPGILVCLSIVWCPPVQKYLNTPAKHDRLVTSARWKAGVLNGFWRLLFVPVFAFAATTVLALDEKTSFDTLKLLKGVRHITNDWNYLGPFLVNVFSTFGAYLSVWLAYTLKMHIAAFIMPLLLSTPLSVIFVVTLCERKQPVAPFLVLSCAEKDGYLIPAVVALWIVQSIYLLFHVYRFKTVSLMREEDLFLNSYYSGPFIEQSLLLNRNIGMDEKKPVEQSREARVFICTTMYRESLEEQRLLLSSIYAIAKSRRMTPEDKNRRLFESHIFFDNGANGMHPSRYAYQLMSLVEETLHGKINEVEKCETPYGIQLHWMLGGDFPFYLHLKDPNKYKKKKRWSQVMYMSYILDHRKNRDNLDENNTFILTTDADVDFTPDSVDILIDRLLRDYRIGAVCGRTHPIGDSPIVWYQKFEYAIGHWFLKVAEHVLGSVTCCPGCFSLLRLGAVRSALPDYSGRVEHGLDFLKQDMGEDRWLCSLMIYAGWRLEYAAAADCRTHCPEEFEEFYKQRRRWIPSTIANLGELCARGIRFPVNIDSVSYLFLFYEVALFFSTIVSPGTVILIMAAGLEYAFSPSFSTLSIFNASLVFIVLLCIFYGYVNVRCDEKTKMQVSKILTIVFAFVMAAVTVGIAVQLIVGFKIKEAAPATAAPQRIMPPANSAPYTEKPMTTRFLLETNKTTPTTTTTSSPHLTFLKVPISAWYFGALAGVYVAAALLHPIEFRCIIHGLWYLFCLPSGYILLIIYSVCNLNNQSWGTREGKTAASQGETLTAIFRSWWSWAKETLDCCGCCKRPTVESPGSEHVDEVAAKQRDPDEGDEGENDDCLSLHESRAKREYARDVESIESFLERISLERHARIFWHHGYDDTSFLIDVDETELRRIGISARGHRERILDHMKRIPDPVEAPVIPKGVQEWLASLYLEEYVDVFAGAGYEKESDVLNLPFLSTDDFPKKITKRGHLKKLLQGLKRIKFPSAVDKNIERAANEYDDVGLSELNETESEFWEKLKKSKLGTEPEVYNQKDKLKLDQLRNYWILLFLVVNAIWILLISLLQNRPMLNVLGTNILALAFLIVYGFVIAVQFLACLWHRVETAIHYLSRRRLDMANRFSHLMDDEDVDMMKDAEEAKGVGSENV